MRFRTVVSEYYAWALEARAAHEGLLARQWWKGWQDRIEAEVSNVDKARVREQALAERTRRVEAGELCFSRADVLRRELDTVLRVIGWNRRRWKPVPGGVASAAGRRWGARSSKTLNERPYDSHVHVDVADETGEMIRRGCYWTSEQATRELRRWYDRHGRGPAHADDLPASMRGLYLMVMLLQGMPRREDIEARDGWRAMVVTPGDILRRAIIAAGEGYEPPVLPDDEDTL